MYNIPMRFLMILFFLLFVLIGCGTNRELKQQSSAALADQAALLIQAGDYTAAATQYLTLASIDKANAVHYRLNAVTAYIDAGLYDDAEKILNEIKIEQDNTPQILRKQILTGQLEIAFDRPIEAIKQLRQVAESDVSKDLKYRYHYNLALAYLAHEDYLQAIGQRIKLQDYLDTSQTSDQNNQAIWAIFEKISTSDLDRLQIIASPQSIAWFELASLYRTYRFQADKLKHAIDSWYQHYPNHPAYFTVVPNLIDISLQIANKPKKIGLLLPFSEPYKMAAMAIRDGFLAARYLGEQANATIPEVSIYDTHTLNIVEVYQQAIDDGVDYIVGPLQKENVNALVEYGQLPVPVLALNQQDNKLQPNNQQLIQFALSPEDEAIAVAETAIADGHTLAFIIAPNTAWGERMATAFTDHWIALGGGVLEQFRFEINHYNFAESVKGLLNINSSQQRARELRNKLKRNLKYVERRRQDADFIFAAITPQYGRQLLPQLRFQRASDLPVYSTSHIFTGVIDTAKDIDLEGVTFIDMPWLIDTTRQLSIIQDALNRHWSQSQSNYRRLYAFGIDAYRLIPELGRLSVEKNSFLSGETGDLSLVSGNVIKRKLGRAKFIAGQPVLLN